MQGFNQFQAVLEDLLPDGRHLRRHAAAGERFLQLGCNPRNAGFDLRGRLAGRAELHLEKRHGRIDHGLVFFEERHGFLTLL